MWAKLDDQAWHNEKLLKLSDQAFRLWVMTLSFVASEWPRGGGAVSMERLEILCTTGGLERMAIDELISQKRLKQNPSKMFLLHDAHKFFPPRDLKKKRALAGKLGGIARSRRVQEKGQAFAKHLPEHLLSKKNNLLSKGSPVPEPVPGNDSLLPSVVESTADNPVSAYVEACRSLGLSEPTARTKARVGVEGKRLLGEGKPRDLVLEATRELARRNASPANLEYIAGDLERERQGVDQSRRQFANPVSREIQDFHVFGDAEREGRQ